MNRLAVIHHPPYHVVWHPVAEPQGCLSCLVAGRLFDGQLFCSMSMGEACSDSRSCRLQQHAQKESLDGSVI